MAKSLTIKRLAIGYLRIGFAISLFQNIFGDNGICMDPLHLKGTFCFFLSGFSFLH